MNTPLAAAGRAQEPLDSRRLWSLWDIMINFELSNLFEWLTGISAFEQNLKERTVLREKNLQQNSALLALLATHDKSKRGEIFEAFEQGQKSVQSPKPPMSPVVESGDILQARQIAAYAVILANRLEMQSALERALIFQEKLKEPIEIQDLYAEIRALRETFHFGLRAKAFYQYPHKRAVQLREYPKDWAAALRAFPLIEGEVQAAVDCYAFDRNTASVFHSMRVVEHGLRAFAAAVNISFENQIWQNIIEEIESEIRRLSDHHWPRSALKSDWMRFYSEAAKEFFHFKDGWRNYVSHGTAPYDAHDAAKVLDHVCSFMNHLGRRFGASEE